VDQFIEVQQKPVYLIKDQHPAGSPEEKTAQTYTEESLTALEAKLDEFFLELDKANLPKGIKEGYRARLESAKLLAKTAREIGTPRFTQTQESPARWLEIIDPKSFETGEIELKYEKAAKQILDDAKQNDTLSEAEKEAQHAANAELAWNELNFQPHEFASAEEFERLHEAKELGGSDLQILFKILFKRTGIEQSETNPDGWKVVMEGNVAMDVNSAAKKISIPPEKTLRKDIALWALPHEGVHILRGENGSRQLVKYLQTGSQGYLGTEEGTAMLSELFSGEKFGHERQALMAARYYAIALSLKTKLDENGQRVAMYSAQEIYNILIDYGISVADAQDTVWRNQRGTSLHREVVTLELPNGESIHQLPVAETFFKDMVYFEGQMAVYDWVRQKLGVESKAQDLNEQFLARVGVAAIRKLMVGHDVALPQLPEGESIPLSQIRARMVEAGKAEVNDLINFLIGAGKLKLEELEDPEMAQVLQRDHAVKFEQIFQPLENQAVQPVDTVANVEIAAPADEVQEIIFDPAEFARQIEELQSRGPEAVAKALEMYKFPVKGEIFTFLLNEAKAVAAIIVKGRTPEELAAAGEMENFSRAYTDYTEKTETTIDVLASKEIMGILKSLINALFFAQIGWRQDFFEHITQALTQQKSTQMPNRARNLKELYKVLDELAAPAFNTRTLTDEELDIIEPFIDRE
jgi:hypothetical protein